MQKIYLDRTAFSGAIFIDSKDTEIISAGTTIHSMGVHHRNEEYQTYANDYDIHFIFDDDIPPVEFFTVPHVDIMAKDSQGGFIGIVYHQGVSESDAPICYINRNLECFIIFENVEDFRSNIGTWRESMQPYDKIAVYRSKAEAEMKIEFIDMSDILP